MSASFFFFLIVCFVFPKGCYTTATVPWERNLLQFETRITVLNVWTAFKEHKPCVIVRNSCPSPLARLWRWKQKGLMADHSNKSNNNYNDRS